MAIAPTAVGMSTAIQGEPQQAPRYMPLLRSAVLEPHSTPSMMINMRSNGALDLGEKHYPDPGLPFEKSYNQRVATTSKAPAAPLTCADCMKCEQVALDDGCGCLALAQFEESFRLPASAVNMNCISNCQALADAPRACASLACACDKLSNWNNLTQRNPYNTAAQQQTNSTAGR